MAQLKEFHGYTFVAVTWGYDDNPDADEMYYLAKIRGFTRSDMAIAFVRDRVEEGYAVGGVVYGGFIKGHEHGERAEVFGVGLTMDYPEPLKW